MMETSPEYRAWKEVQDKIFDLETKQRGVFISSKKTEKAKIAANVESGRLLTEIKRLKLLAEDLRKDMLNIPKRNPIKSYATCNICGRSADNPTRVYDARGKVIQGCVDAFHTGHLVTPSESAHWHNRPAAKKIRAEIKKGQMGKGYGDNATRRNPAARKPKLVWHTFDGGTAAERGKKSYQAITGELDGRQQYQIDPVSTARGRHSHYILRSFGFPPHFGYSTLGKFSAPQAAKSAAAEHYAQHATVGNPAGRKFTAQRKALQQRKPRHAPGTAIYHVQVKTAGGRWHTLAIFENSDKAQEYARALHAQYPASTYQVDRQYA